MNKTEYLKQGTVKIQFKIFTSIMLVGLINIALLATFGFYITRSTILNRAQDQLIALCSQSEDRLNLFLNSPHYQKLSSNLDQISNDGIYTDLVGQLLEKRDGLGKSGEAYLVGQDGFIKTNSRFGPKWKGKKLENKSFTEAMLGHSGVNVVNDYRNIEVLSAYKPFQYKSFHFALLCEMDYAEILAPLYDMQFPMIITGFILTVISGLAGLLSGQSLVKSIIERDKTILKLETEKAVILKEQAQKTFQLLEEERQKISHDAHDGLGQILTAIKWKNKDEEIKTLCDNAIEELTRFKELSPSIEHFGLKNSISNLIRLSQSDRMKINVHFPEYFNEENLNYECCINFYRIIQELIQNAMKHSQATEINFNIDFIKENLSLLYDDNGIGINNGAWPPQSLYYRVDVYGGEMLPLSLKPLKIKILFPGKKRGPI